MVFSLVDDVFLIESHISQLDCPSEITDIDQCRHRGWGRHKCSHHEDVCIECFCEYSSVIEKYLSGGMNVNCFETMIIYLVLYVDLKKKKHHD